MNAEIIAVGTELLLGDILNTNAQYLAGRLAQLGFTVHYQTVVGDNAERLAGVLRTAKARSTLLVVCGGLGPTEDDLTKQTAAQVFGDVLVEDAQERSRIEAHFAALGRTMTANNLQQALIPAHGGKFTNDNGTAPGILLRDGEKQAILLPGPPSELKPMFETKVLPYLRTLSRGALVSRWLHVIGIPESQLDLQLAPYLNAADPTAALYAKTGEVHIRITAHGETEAQAAHKADATAAKLAEELGDAVYSTDGSDLETTVVHLFKQAGVRLALAESCTGGLLAQRITTVSGASDIFHCGIVSYSEAIKHKLLGVSEETLTRHTVYSAPVAAQMAKGAAALADAEYGVGITGIAGPTGGPPGIPVGTVFIAVHTPQGTFVRRAVWTNRSRQDVRIRAATAALDMLRRAVQNLPQPDAVRYADEA